MGFYTHSKIAAHGCGSRSTGSCHTSSSTSRSRTRCVTGFWHPVQFSRSDGAACCGFRPPRAYRSFGTGFRRAAFRAVSRPARQPKLPAPVGASNSRAVGGAHHDRCAIRAPQEPWPLSGTVSVRRCALCCQVTRAGGGRWPGGPAGDHLVAEARRRVTSRLRTLAGRHAPRPAPPVIVRPSLSAVRTAAPQARRVRTPGVSDGSGSPPRHRTPPAARDGRRPARPRPAVRAPPRRRTRPRRGTAPRRRGGRDRRG